MSNQKNDQKIKVLWLTSSYPRYEDDSASIFLRHLAEVLTKHNIELHILSPDHPSVDYSFHGSTIIGHRFCYFFPKSLQKLAYGSGILPNLRARPWLFFQVPFFLLTLFFSSWQLIRQHKPDLIHAHWIFPQGTVAALLGKLTGTPVISTAHGGDAFALQGSILAKIKRWTIQNSTEWTSNTTATSKAVGNKLSHPVIIPMGIDYHLFSTGKPITKPVDTLVLLFVGRLVEKKGMHDLITAYSLLPKDLRHKTVLWIVGDGEDRNSLEALTCSLKLSDRVIFYGRLPNKQLPDFYAAADVFIAPSVIDSSGDTEGQGVIILEAMASGTALISTKTGGISEIVTHGENGFLVTPKNPEELANSIECLLNDSALRNLLAETGKKHAQHYDWKRIGNQFAALYNTVIKN